MSGVWQLLAAGVGYPMGMIVLEVRFLPVQEDHSSNRKCRYSEGLGMDICYLSVWTLLTSDFRGYHWNPYGVICLLAVCALPFMYVTHERVSTACLSLPVINALTNLSNNTFCLPYWS